MKRLIMMVLCVFLLAGSAQAVTIEGMTLYGGNGTTFLGPDKWLQNGSIWSTTNNENWWVLGVSSDAGGPLLNNTTPGPTYTTISGLAFDNYYLYAEPSVYTLGNNPQLQVNLSGGTTIAAIFQLEDVNGSGTAWTWKDGDNEITLGWASGTANLVGTGHTLYASGYDDVYLKVGISDPNPVPLPGAVWLLGTGLVGLAGLRRRFGR